MSDLQPHSRKPSFDQLSPPPCDPRTAAPTTFFLARSPHASGLDSRPLVPDDAEQTRDSMYGVQSLDETLSRGEWVGSPRQQLAESFSTASSLKQDPDQDEPEESISSRRRSTLRPFGSGIRESSLGQSVSDLSSRPLTPLNLSNPDDPSSLPSSPKSISNQSLRPLDDISITDEINSQVIASGDEDEHPGGSPRPGPVGASQLIMPSLKMPSRRPFTDRGKAIGRFKLLLAGAPGNISLSIRHLDM